MGCRRNASRSHFGGWGLHRQPQPRVTATGVACSELSQQLLKFLNPPRPSFNCLSSFLPHSSRLAHGCNPLSQNGYHTSNIGREVGSNGKQTARKCFQEDQKIKKSTPGDLYAESGQTLHGSFSAVSKPFFESKYCRELNTTKY